MSKNTKEKYIDLITTKPKHFFALGLVLFLLLFPSIFFIKTHFGTKIWFRSDDQNIKTLEKFEKDFGNDESSILIINSKSDFFTGERLSLLNTLTDKMWEVHDVVRVDSLWNHYHSYANGDELVTEPFLDLKRIDQPGYLNKKRREALGHKIINNYFISKDGKTAYIFARMKVQDEREAEPKRVVEDLNRIVSEYSKDGLEIYHIGGPTMNVAYKESSFKDIQVLLPILILFIIVYLYISYRSIAAIVIPMSVVLSSLCGATALANFLGFKFNSLTFILPSILIAIGIADTVHIMNTFYKKMQLGHSAVQACREALEKNIWPVFLTSISTTIGFFSLVPSDIAPISELGLLAGVGTLFALCFSYLIVIPQILIYGMKPKKVYSNEVVHVSSFSKKSVEVIHQFRWGILGVFFTALFIFTYLGFKNEVNSNPYKFFKEDHYIAKTNDVILSSIGGAGGPEIIVDSLSSEGIKDPSFLKKVDAFSNWLLTHEYVNKVISIIDILKEMNQSLMAGDPKFYKISDNQSRIAEELFLYTMSLPQGLDINNRVDLTNRSLRLSVLWSLQDSKESMAAVDMIEEKAKEMGLVITVTGKGQLFQRMNSYIVETFFKSMSGALFLISLLMMIVFKSFKLGMLSLIPNLSPIFFGAGLLKILEKPIDMGSAIVASVTLGIAVDDTIHFIAHFKRLRHEGLSTRESLENVFSTTGSALVITTIILVSCFGLFMFGNLVTNINFGILCALVLSLALVCDLIVLPAIFFITEKK